MRANSRPRAAWRTLALAASLAGSVAGLMAQRPPAPDNSKVNARDRKPAAVTADQQANTRSDLETTQLIRKAVIADKKLSTYAHNVKIVTKSGKVTLKGPARTPEEKSTIETMANEVVGASNVTNQISIASKSGATKKKAGS